jgi:hypothetical protein
MLRRAGGTILPDRVAVVPNCGLIKNLFDVEEPVVCLWRTYPKISKTKAHPSRRVPLRHRQGTTSVLWRLFSATKRVWMTPTCHLAEGDHLGPVEVTGFKLKPSWSSLE